MKLKLITALCLTLFFVCSFRNNKDVKPARILHQMFDSIKGIRTLRLKVTALERVDRKFSSATSEIKVSTHPRKLYYNNGQKKIEILYNAEVSPHKALVKPNIFPYISLWLDPVGNLMRRNQHYTINELGYDFIGKSIALTIKKDRDGLANFTYLGKYVRNGYNCYMLEYENKSFAYINYTIGEKETASSIAYKLIVNDYLLRYANNLLNDFGYLKKGRVIRVPNLYCKKAILYIDDHLLLPVSISIYDDIGLFESYDFAGIEINRPFHANEFERNYDDYGF